MIRFPVWFVCDGCGREQDGDYEMQYYDGLRKPDPPAGWTITVISNTGKLLCAKCRRKAGF